MSPTTVYLIASSYFLYTAWTIGISIYVAYLGKRVDELNRSK